MTLSRADLSTLNRDYERLTAEAGPHWKYRSAPAGCDLGGMGGTSTCFQEAVAACAGNTSAEGRGPLVDVFRMWVDKDGDPLPAAKWPSEPLPGSNGWALVGSTCLPNLVPGADPVPTIEMVVEAFHKTPWAKGRISTQPKGDVTLVNLKTFYRVDWSTEEGTYAPGETDHVDILGFDVQIRPKLVSYVYHFGDSTASEPTTSPGGVYPDGDVVHTYTAKGRYTSYVDVTFGADFRIGNGAWISIPDTVTVQQPGTVVTVKEAKAVLVR